jgi:23S rRNA pseudouridine2605 synthase
VKLLWEDGPKAKLLVTIHEGRNRQIRRMCEAANMQVTRLRRISEGLVQLGDLPLGKWRHLTKEEIAKL